MAIPVEMPKMSDTMEEGVLVSWLASEGDAVSAGDVIAQVETDKATMDLEVYDDGVLLKRLIEEGDAVPIGGLIAVLGSEGEDISDVLKKYQGGTPGGDGQTAEAEAPEVEAPEAEASPAKTAKAPAAEPAPAPERAAQAPQGDGSPAPAPEGRIKSSPLARRMADDHGIDLASVQGSGPEGRIVKRDVEAFVAREGERPPVAPAPGPQPVQVGDEAVFETVPVSQMRKAIARRVSQSKFTAPHFYLTVDVDMEKAVAFRTQLNELAASQDRPKVSFNDLITKACAAALRQHPYVNASYAEQSGEIYLHKRVHIAVAMAIGEGLVTPVVRNADQKGIGQIAEETRTLAERARDRKLQPADYEGSTFMTSNLGMFGIEEFTAIINPPNACVLAIGAIRDEPVVKDGQIVPGKRMRVTLSCDHRLVDGATGAQFLGTVKRNLEEPLNLLL